MKKRSSVRSRLKRFYKFWSRITFELVITVHINREQFVSIQYNKSKISNDTIAHKRYFTFCQPLHKKIRRNFRIIFLILHAWHVTQDQKNLLNHPIFELVIYCWIIHLLEKAESVETNLKCRVYFQSTIFHKTQTILPF